MAQNALTVVLQGSADLAGSLSSTETINAEGIVKVKTDIAAGATAQEVDLSPVTKAGVIFLMIKASQYDDGTGKLKYKVNADLTEFKLDAPHVIRGPGQAAMLPADPANLKFANAYLVPVTVEIFLAYKTT